MFSGPHGFPSEAEVVEAYMATKAMPTHEDWYELRGNVRCGCPLTVVMEHRTGIPMKSVIDYRLKDSRDFVAEKLGLNPTDTYPFTEGFDFTCIGDPERAQKERDGYDDSLGGKRCVEIFDHGVRVAQAVKEAQAKREIRK